jgi:hypothetical protein
LRKVGNINNNIKANKTNMNNVPSVTLQTAVLLAVKDFAQASKTFSIFELTQAIRTKCNNGQLEIPEVEVSGGGQYRFQIEHTKVKALFLELRDTGVFDPDFSLSEAFNQGGGYRTYTPSPIGTTTVGAPTSATPTSVPVLTANAPTATNANGSVSFDSDVQARIKNYLNNCRNRQFRPSLRHVQSAIKRGDHMTGLTVEALKDFITGLGFSFSTDPNALSRYQVVV